MSYINNIPRSTKESLDRYVQHKIPTGGFLQAVLSNDLFSAMAKADSESSEALKHIVMYIYNELPSECWGSKEKVREFLNS